jgi:predicted SnoaL-like aldol condensation-catalyzing enzyme
MSAEENKELGRRFIENGYQEVMRGNLDAVHQYFADNYHDHTSLHPEESGVGGVKELIADAGQASPDLRLEVMDIAANEDVVFVHWQATGRHEEQHQVNRHVRDIQPTGEVGTASGISLYRIEGGKFVEGWNYHNVLEFALARGMGDGSSGSS